MDEKWVADVYMFGYFGNFFIINTYFSIEVYKLYVMLSY